jgi:hypothetical protein
LRKKDTCRLRRRLPRRECRRCGGQSPDEKSLIPLARTPALTLHPVGWHPTLLTLLAKNTTYSTFLLWTSVGRAKGVTTEPSLFSLWPGRVRLHHSLLARTESRLDLSSTGIVANCLQVSSFFLHASWMLQTSGKRGLGVLWKRVSLYLDLPFLPLLYFTSFYISLLRFDL